MVPSFEEVATGKINVSQLKEVDVIDLLGREEVSLDLESISHQLEGQTILVTGAGARLVQRFVGKFWHLNQQS